MLTKEHLERLAKVLPNGKFGGKTLTWNGMGGENCWITIGESDTYNDPVDLILRYRLSIYPLKASWRCDREEFNEPSGHPRTADTLTEAVVLAALDAAEKEESNA